MFEYFDKKSSFFTSDRTLITENEIIDQKKLLKDDFLNFLIIIIQVIVYYIDPSKCNNLVFVENIEDINIEVIKKLFPLFNIYSDYENDIQDLKNNNLEFILVFNNKMDDMKFAKVLTEKYEPYASLINYYIGYNQKYLDGKLLNNYFSIKEKFTLLVMGIGYREWNNQNLIKNFKSFQKSRETKKYLNPIDNSENYIFSEKGLYNGMDETYLTTIVIDYLNKINKNANYNNVKKILEIILKDKNLDIIRLIN